MKMCEILVLHPDDKNSAIYQAVCHSEGDGGCATTLELNDTLTYEWQLSCDDRVGSNKVDGETCNEDGRCVWYDRTLNRRLRRRRNYGGGGGGGSGYDGSLLGISVNTGTAALLILLFASLFSF